MAAIITMSAAVAPVEELAPLRLEQRHVGHISGLSAVHGLNQPKHTNQRAEQLLSDNGNGSKEIKNERERESERERRNVGDL